MTEFSSLELSKKIKSGELFHAYYIYGKDISAVELLTKGILKKHLGKQWENNYTKLSGEGINIGALTDMLEICPMFAVCNAILINDLNAEELTADSLKTLIGAIENLPDYTLLIINITSFDIKKGKKTITAKNKKLADSISKIGAVCNCELKTLPVLTKTITETAAKRGCSISKKNAEMLAEICKRDSLIIHNELEKLCAYCESSEISASAIEELVSVGIETDAFRLSRSISECDPNAAMSILNNLIQKKEEPISIISAVSMVFIDLYRARTALSADKRLSDVIEDFGYGGRRFAIENAFRDCRKISAEALRSCISLLRNADRSLKQTGAMPAVILEKTITEMLIAVRRK